MGWQGTNGTLQNKQDNSELQTPAHWLGSGKNLLALSVLGAAAGVFAFLFLDPHTSRLQSFQLPGDFKKAIHLMELFGHGVGVLLVVWLLALVGQRRWKQVVVAVAVASSAGALLKMLFVRHRPIPGSGQEVAGIEIGWLTKSNFVATDPAAGLVRDSLHSFPSGHATTAFALATALAILYPRGRWLFYVVAVLVCVQRVFARAHYVSDVIAGATIGFVLCRLLMDAMNRRQSGRRVTKSRSDSVAERELLPGERQAA